MIQPRLVDAEDAMEEAEIERIATRMVEKMKEPKNVRELAKAIAAELHRLGLQYTAEIARLGERLDKTHY